eukprot:jgi/Undpi1/3488/HiC_scaffold_16.g06860.m1
MTGIEHRLSQADEQETDESMPVSSDSVHTKKNADASPRSSMLCSAEQRLRSRIDKFVAGYSLTPMGKAVAFNWITSIGSDTTEEFTRVRRWLIGRLNAFGRQRSASGSATFPLPPGASQWQRGCPEIIPGLRSKAFWSREELPWVADFEKGFDNVRKELVALRGRGGFQPYRAPRGRPSGRSASDDGIERQHLKAASDGIGSHCHEGGDWNVFYLFLHNIEFEKESHKGEEEEEEEEEEESRNPSSCAVWPCVALVALWLLRCRWRLTNADESFHVPGNVCADKSAAETSRPRLLFGPSARYARHQAQR